jgi:lactoylglutathione lyase
MENKTNVKQAVPFFGVTNMERSLRYYVEGIGFTMSQSWVVNDKIRWCWLQHGTAALMLQEFAGKDGPSGSIARDILGTGVSIYFICADALAMYHAITARGIQASEPFVGNQMWVTGLTDPDGYRIFFESYTDVPEETKLSQWAG